MQAIEGAGRSGEGIVITGIDANPQARDAIAAGGNFEASIAQDFQAIGSTTADAVARVLAGETIKQTVIYVPTKLVTAANVGDCEIAAACETVSTARLLRAPCRKIGRLALRRAMSLLTLENVSKAYAGVPALRSVSLSIAAGRDPRLDGRERRGQVHAHQDSRRRGAADRRTSLSTGRRVAIDSPNAALAHGLRFIHQELNVVPTLSVAENIFLGRPYPRRFGGFIDWESVERRSAAGARPAWHFAHRSATQDGAAWRRRSDAGVHFGRLPRQRRRSACAPT